MPTARMKINYFVVDERSCDAVTIAACKTTGGIYEWHNCFHYALRDVNR